MADSLENLTNIAFSLSRIAETRPDQIAVAEPWSRWQRLPLRYRTIDFATLNQRSDQIARGVRQAGVPRGARISLMIPPGIEFVAWVFGLLKAGVVAVLIDPGMGRKNMIRCLAESNPDGMAGIGLAHAARWMFRKRFPQSKFHFLVGGRFFPGCQVTRNWDHTALPPLPEETPQADEPAAIIFTTGSTGPPKGVLYRHRHFIAQNIQLREYFQIEPGGVDVSGFPLFALFNAGMGTTTVFPLMDATRPARVWPPYVLDAVEHFQANQSFGSPALWNAVATYCEREQKTLPTLQRVLTAGAPVPAHVLKRVRKMIHPEGCVYTPYGATEALPVACIESRVVLQETAEQTAVGRGTCVGHHWPQMEWQVIEITDQNLTDISQVTPLPRGQLGELIVRGPVVTDRYVTRPEANAWHKIQDGTTIWHRMGDVGYFDNQDRFWFCGRKSHRVQTPQGTLFTIPCEAIINQHPAIYRCGLAGVGEPGRQVPVIVAEPWPDHWPQTRPRRQRLLAEIRELAQRSPLTQSIQHFFLMRQLPVDIRHNAKIFREQLATWAAVRISN